MREKILQLPVRSVHGLLVHSWVPVAVIEDHSVRRRQVDPKTACPRGEEKDEDVLPVLEVGDHVPALVDLAAAIEPHVAVLPVAHVLLQQVDHPRHLAVDQDPVAALLQPGKQPVQDKELSGV